MDFELIYKQKYDPICRFCFRMTGDEETARDKAQETFIKLYELMQKDHIPQQMVPWLYKVSGNLCLNELNRIKMMKEKRNKININTGTEHDNPESSFIKNESAEMIRELIDHLGHRQRILILMYQDGLSYKELSQATGIPYNSIGKTLWRIIDQVSEQIKKIDNGY